MRRFGLAPGLSGLSGMSGMSIGGYSRKVLGTATDNLLAYWELSDIAEPVGRIAPNNALSGSVRDGLYFNVGVGYNVDGPGDNLPAISLDGTGNVCFYTADLASDYNPAELTVSLWIQIAAAEWADGTFRLPVQFGANGTTNRMFIRKSTVADRLDFVHRGGGSLDIISHNFSPQNTNWFNAVVTVSESNDRMRAYINGVQSGVDLTGLGANVGALGANLALGGGGDCTGAVSPHIGNLARVAVWSKELSALEIAPLGNIL